MHLTPTVVSGLFPLLPMGIGFHGHKASFYFLRSILQINNKKPSKSLSGMENGKGEEPVCLLSYWMELIKLLLQYWFSLPIIHAEIKNVMGYSTEPIIITAFITKYECNYTS